MAQSCSNVVSEVQTSEVQPCFQLLVFQYYCCDWQYTGNAFLKTIRTYSSKDDLKKFFDDEFEVSKQKYKECQKDFWENFEKNWNTGMTDCEDTDCACGKIYLYGDIGKIKTDVLLTTNKFEYVWPYDFNNYFTDEEDEEETLKFIRSMDRKLKIFSSQLNK